MAYVVPRLKKLCHGGQLWLTIWLAETKSYGLRNIMFVISIDNYNKKALD